MSRKKRFEYPDKPNKATQSYEQRLKTRQKRETERNRKIQLELIKRVIRIEEMVRKLESMMGFSQYENSLNADMLDRFALDDDFDNSSDLVIEETVDSDLVDNYPIKNNLPVQ